jgi:hypothetical protein
VIKTGDNLQLRKRVHFHEYEEHLVAMSTEDKESAQRRHNVYEIPYSAEMFPLDTRPLYIMAQVKSDILIRELSPVHC